MPTQLRKPCAQKPRGITTWGHYILFFVNLQSFAQNLRSSHKFGPRETAFSRRQSLTAVGTPARELHPGDVVNIPVGVKHWHGAAPDSWFSHLALEVPGEETGNEWLEAVDDDEYGKLK